MFPEQATSALPTATSIVLGLLLSLCCGCAAQLPGAPVDDDRGRSLVIDDDVEDALLEANGGRPHLLELHNPPNAPTTTVTVHGTKTGPSELQPLHQRAVARGDRLMTFIYDDRGTSVRASGRGLARELLAKRHHWGPRLRIEAHSMGTRVVLAALWYLDDRATSLGLVELSLIAAPLGGIAAADLAPLTPTVIASIFGAVSSEDMGSHSALQGIIESMDLTPNVSARVYVGDGDSLVDCEAERFRRVVDRLDAHVIRVRGAGHVSVLGAVARSTLHARTQL
jgi:pimeloyl-ACP methyl ester carboxylesterase